MKDSSEMLKSIINSLYNKHVNPFSHLIVRGAKRIEPLYE